MPNSPIRGSGNPNYQRWKKLAAHPEERDCPWVPVEGPKAIRDLAAGRSIELLLIRSDGDTDWADLRDRAKEVRMIAPALWKGLSDVRTPQGVLAFFAKPVWNWEQMPDVLLYLDGIQDPGNLGTLLRSADALGPAGIVTSSGSVSPFNRKVVRASAGALFRVPVMEQAPFQELRRHGYETWAAEPQSGEALHLVHPAGRYAALIGAEGPGLDRGISEAADHRFHIPMRREAESLNAAVAGALILYEWSTRRNPFEPPTPAPRERE